MSRNKLFLKGSCYESRIDFAPHCCGDDRDGNGTSRYSKSNSRQGKPSLPQAVKQLLATASTPQDHLVLAEYFRWEAGKMKEEGQYHLEMAEIYRVHPLPFDSKLPMPMQAHCKYFAEKAREAATADEELADDHEQMAQQLSQAKQQ